MTPIPPVRPAGPSHASPHAHHDTPRWLLALLLAALGMLGPFAVDTYRVRPLLAAYREVGGSILFLLLALAAGFNFNGFFSTSFRHRYSCRSICISGQPSTRCCPTSRSTRFFRRQFRGR